MDYEEYKPALPPGYSSFFNQKETTPKMRISNDIKA
jgi:hypothetical protein